MDLIGLTVKEASKLLRTGQISSLELTNLVLDRIENLNPKLQAYLTVTPELARQHAQKADEGLAQARKDPQLETSPLLGVPLAVKDLLCLKDIRCTCGSRILENFVPPYTATSVNKILQAGWSPWERPIPMNLPWGLPRKTQPMKTRSTPGIPAGCPAGPAAEVLLP